MLESCIHTLRDCGFAKMVWKSIVPEQGCQLFFGLHFERWLWWNLTNEGNFQTHGVKWVTLFLINLLVYMEE